jgi:hypothetical protein
MLVSMGGDRTCIFHTVLVALICDYFMAPSSEAAASVVDWPGGPANPPAERRSFLRRAKRDTEAYGVVSLPGIEPTVTMGQLDALLTRRSIMEVIHDPEREPVAAVDGGERVVVPLGQKFEEAIAATPDDEVPELSRQWSQAEEFWGQGDPDVLAGAVRRLAALVRQGRGRQHHLYCWVCV